MIDRRFSVAPMMACTDKHCRYLLRLLSPNALLYSEMVVTGALLHGRTDHFLSHMNDEPCALQLGGSDPDALARCARIVEEYGYDEINLNVGCPSDRVQQGGIGACLMADPGLVAECFIAMAENTSLPVTIKSRIGIDKDDDYPFFKNFVLRLYNAGCRIFIVHARVAILTGLSPKENREIPPLKYDYVDKIKAEFPEATFVLNGGVKTAVETTELLTRFDGVMLGRAPYNNPFLLAEIDHAVTGAQLPCRFDIVSGYRDYIIARMNEGVALKHMTKHLFGMFTGFAGARAFRRHLSTYMNENDAQISVLDDALDCVSQSSRFENPMQMSAVLEQT